MSKLTLITVSLKNSDIGNAIASRIKQKSFFMNGDNFDVLEDFGFRSFSWQESHSGVVSSNSDGSIVQILIGTNPSGDYPESLIEAINDGPVDWFFVCNYSEELKTIDWRSAFRKSYVSPAPLISKLSEIEKFSLLALSKKIAHEFISHEIQTLVLSETTSSIDTEGVPKLVHLIEAGNADNVRRALRGGAQVCSVDNHGKSALHVSVELGNLELVEILLDEGADPNAIDHEGKTPAFYIDGESAIKAKALFEKLMAHGLNVNHSGESGSLLWHLSGPHPVKTFAIHAGGKVIAPEGVYQGSIDDNLRLAIEHNDVETVKTLVEKSQNFDRFEACGWAVRNDSLEALHQIFPNLSWRAADADTYQIAYSAACCRSFRTLQLFAENVIDIADVPEQIIDGIVSTLAESELSGDVLRLLLDAGLDPNMALDEEDTFLSSCLLNGSFSNAFLLIERGAKASSTEASAVIFSESEDFGNKALALRKLFTAGLRVSELYNDMTLTQCLAQATKVDADMVRELVNAGGSLEDPDDEGSTPLLIAVRDNNIQAVKALLTCGANPLAENENGESAWSYCRFSNYEYFRPIVEPFVVDH